MVCLVFDIFSPLNKIILNKEDSYSVCELRKQAERHLEQIFGFGACDFYLVYNGRLLSLQAHESLLAGDVHVIPRLLGGKGGFGSMLRAIGAQIEKTTNREACRDLSGRRLRDINEEKRLKKWIAEQAEREQEALERKRKKLEKLREEIKHEFTDEDYTKTRLEMPDKIQESVEQGLQATTDEPATSQESTKDIIAKKSVKKKTKRKLWVDDLLDDSEASDLEDNEEESPKKKIKIS